ncbi:MAG: V-type ATP synthase subunit E [Firmicutes bacterium]|nr:V-type ATP synthase subunit E [Bacillota bacterium]
MEAQAILARIEQDAQAAQAQLLRDARAKAEQTRERSEEKINQARTAALETARREALQLDDRLQRMARLDARKALLAAKRRVLDEAFREALSMMRAMPREEARAFGLAVLLQAARGDETVVPDPDSVWCDAAFVREANEALQKAGKPGRLALAKESRAIGDGFLLERGGMEVHCTYQAALEAKRMDLEAEIAALLFA